MKIICVFKESKDFPVDYVRIFSNVFRAYHPDIDQLCLTDYSGKGFPSTIEKIPFNHDFIKEHGWFGKMELFRPDIEDDLFYCDLDNIIRKPLDNFFEYHQSNPDMPFMINDVDPKQKRMQSAVMYIPNSKKHLVWDPFIDSATAIIKQAGKFGDAKIIRESDGWKTECKTYQTTFASNCIISYRHGWINRKIQSNDVQIVCMHGKNEKPLQNKFAIKPLVKDHVLKWNKQ